MGNFASRCLNRVPKCKYEPNPSERCYYALDDYGATDGGSYEAHNNDERFAFSTIKEYANPMTDMEMIPKLTNEMKALNCPSSAGRYMGD